MDRLDGCHPAEHGTQLQTHIFTPQEETSSPRDGKGAYTHIHTCAHSANKPPHNYLHHT